jgi:hypothetical protein
MGRPCRYQATLPDGVTLHQKTTQNSEDLFWKDFFKLKGEWRQIEFDRIAIIWRDQRCHSHEQADCAYRSPRAREFQCISLVLPGSPVPQPPPTISTNRIKASSSILSSASDSGPFPAIMATASRA